MCRNFQKTILIRYAKGKEKDFCISNMLRVHTGLLKLIKTNVYDLHINQMNSFDIGKPCIKIAKSEVLFEQYRIALNRDKYDIDLRNDNAIRRNQKFFDFMQQLFNRLDGFVKTFSAIGGDHQCKNVVTN